MDIDWFGQSCFRIREGNVTAITDPYDRSIGYSLPRLRADIVTVSHDAPGHSAAAAIKGEPKVLARPGEYEVKNIFITGVPTAHDKRGGKDRGANTVYVFDLDGLTICHLGDLGHVPTQPQAEALGNVSILLVPVGGVSTIGAGEAAEIVSMLEPQIVIPMHFAHPDLKFKLDTATKFFKEMGIKVPAPVPSFKVTKDSLPEETQVVLLEAKQKE